MRLLAAVGTIVSGVLSYAALKLLLPGWSGARHLAWFVPALLVYWWLARVFVAHQYGVDINPPSEPVKPVEPSTVLWRHPVLVARLVLKYLLRVVVVLAMLGSATFAVSSWRVAHAVGVPGVVTFTNTCAHCDWYGDFVSDDGSVVVSNVDVVDAPDTTKGATAHVWLSTKTHQVYTETGTSTWLVSGIIALLCAAYLLVVAARLRHRQSAARARRIASGGGV